ncbi:MAG: NBR1-Ig-like domain-containing protein, partial [Anaerolineae bacterium]|nr:NBR1-Ig-like domain-containing protein [Anaerolineae bacterium]
PLPSATWTATLPPTPTATFTFTPTFTYTPIPTATFTPSPSPLCNAAHLLAQGYVNDSAGPVTIGSHIALIWQVTNVGTCTWTNEYSIILLENDGFITPQSQYFIGTAVPGETIHIPVELTVPSQPGNYHAVWKFQDPLGELFGYGPHASYYFVLNLSINEEVSVVSHKNWIIPSQTCSNQPTESALPRYARLMHDPQWMPWPSRMGDPDWPSGYYYDWYPETVPLWTRPRGGDGRFPYSRAWLEFLRAIQPDDETAVWIARVAAGLFNRTNDFIPILNLDELQKEPIAESISSGGNVVKVLEIKNRSARIEMFYLSDGPPDAQYYNYQSVPWLVTKFTSVSIDGDLGNAGGIDVYFPNVAKQPEGYWVDMVRVEMFPELPFCATVTGEAPVKASPSTEAYTYGYMKLGQQFVIYDYMPKGSDVWGRIKEGWVQLVYQVDGQPVYPTTWSMETRPPIKFPDPPINP